MNYFSINKQAPIVDFKQATINGQAPDKGLYFPEYIPRHSEEWIATLKDKSNEDIAFDVIKPFVGGAIPQNVLQEIVEQTVNFDMPLVPVTDSISSLELFHGPTLAFKDVGARFMSRCLGYFLRDSKQQVTVLVATSGDTGGAVANGFYDVEGVQVVILYPSGKVSPVQEKQLTTLGKNIHALEVKGTFDDCQHIVKQAFLDQELTQKHFLTSANSINVARWLPQQFYYFFAHKQWKGEHPPVICVPSGNFGNICAGILAYHTGMPATHFIAACNVNDIVSTYLSTEKIVPKQAVATLSNAMDVGNPSNFVRIIELFGHQFPQLKGMLSSTTITDKETLDTIKQVYESHQYILDPHGAVGFLSLERHLQKNKNQKGYFLETAHPVKFPTAVEQMTGREVAIPQALSYLLKAEKKSVVVEASYDEVKEFLWQMG